MATDYELIHGQLHVTNSPSKPEALGRGPATIRGATYLQGPVQMGNDSSFESVEATVMMVILVTQACLVSMWILVSSVDLPIPKK